MGETQDGGTPPPAEREKLMAEARQALYTHACPACGVVHRKAAFADEQVYPLHANGPAENIGAALGRGLPHRESLRHRREHD